MVVEASLNERADEMRGPMALQQRQADILGTYQEASAEKNRNSYSARIKGVVILRRVRRMNSSGTDCSVLLRLLEEQTKDFNETR